MVLHFDSLGDNGYMDTLDIDLLTGTVTKSRKYTTYRVTRLLKRLRNSENNQGMSSMMLEIHFCASPIL